MVTKKRRKHLHIIWPLVIPLTETHHTCPVQPKALYMMSIRMYATPAQLPLSAEDTQKAKSRSCSTAVQPCQWCTGWSIASPAVTVILSHTEMNLMTLELVKVVRVMNALWMKWIFEHKSSLLTAIYKERATKQAGEHGLPIMQHR